MWMLSISSQSALKYLSNLCSNSIDTPPSSLMSSSVEPGLSLLLSTSTFQSFETSNFSCTKINLASCPTFKFTNGIFYYQIRRISACPCLHKLQPGKRVYYLDVNNCKS